MKNKSVNSSAVIRKAIATIHPGTLKSCKPRHVYEIILKDNPKFDITSSVKTTTSVLLKKARTTVVSTAISLKPAPQAITTKVQNPPNVIDLVLHYKSVAAAREVLNQMLSDLNKVELLLQIQ
jgi:hypothetical protein